MNRTITIVIRPAYGFRKSPMSFFVNMIRNIPLCGIAFQIVSTTESE